MSHSRAVALMVLVTFLWSIAGVVTRHLDGTGSFEVTFWRSAFNAAALAIGLRLLRGPGLWQSVRHSPWPVCFSGFCWAVMFTAFMLALTLTTATAKPRWPGPSVMPSNLKPLALITSTASSSSAAPHAICPNHVPSSCPRNPTGTNWPIEFFTDV